MRCIGFPLKTGDLGFEARDLDALLLNDALGFDDHVALKDKNLLALVREPGMDGAGHLFSITPNIYVDGCGIRICRRTNRYCGAE
jgi:hypothetical protein